LSKELLIRREGSLRLLKLILRGSQFGLLRQSLILCAAVLHVRQRRLSTFEAGFCTRDAICGIGCVHTQEFLSAPHLLAEMNVKFCDDTWIGSVGLEVHDRLNLSIGGNRTGEVLAADASGPNFNDRLLAHEEESPHHDDNREQNP
jgi:hypothetical protein